MWKIIFPYDARGFRMVTNILTVENTVMWLRKKCGKERI